MEVERGAVPVSLLARERVLLTTCVLETDSLQALLHLSISTPGGGPCSAGEADMRRR